VHIFYKLVIKIFMIIINNDGNARAQRPAAEVVISVFAMSAGR
jgi:hypothetical protein